MLYNTRCYFPVYSRLPFFWLRYFCILCNQMTTIRHANCNASAILPKKTIGWELKIAFFLLLLFLYTLIIVRNWRHYRCLSLKLSVDLKGKWKSQKQTFFSKPTNWYSLCAEWLPVIIFDLIRCYKIVFERFTSRASHK